MIDQAKASTRNPAQDSDDLHMLRTENLIALGGVVGGLAASACCLVPLALFGLGVSGAWIGSLTRLAPYQPYVIALTAACLGAGYWQVYRTRQQACAEADTCATPLPRRIVKSGLVLSTILVAAALAVDFLVPLFYG